jgi:hypothetical protein
VFLTFQLPFVDLRRFLADPAPSVPPYPAFDNPPRRLDFEEVVNRKLFVRSFGNFRLRGYEPDFSVHLNKGYKPREDEAQWKEAIKSLWKEEYLYTSSRRGLRFAGLEKARLAGGKLINPRCKVRAIRFSPFQPGHPLWSPCVRIEVGVLFSVAAPLQGGELELALADFARLKVGVPVYRKDGAGSSAVIDPIRLSWRPLIEQGKNLAALIVEATTAQHVVKVHGDMVAPGAPLMTVHHFPGELASLPDNLVPVSKQPSSRGRVGYLQMKKPAVGVWLFDVPAPQSRSATDNAARIAARNVSIAVMRYWSELQAMLTLRRALIDRRFNFDLRQNSLLSDHLNRSTRFLLSSHWHGTRLDTIRSVVNAYRFALPESREDMEMALQDLRRQVARKVIDVARSETQIFVSYSHRDSRYLGLLHEVFDVPEFAGRIAYFDDGYVDAGEEWERVIAARLAEASIAIFLVSPHFLDSSYIRSREIPTLLDRLKRGQLRILPVLLEGEIPSRGFLASIQFLNRTPLCAQAEEDVRRLLRDRLAAEVRTAITPLA